MPTTTTPRAVRNPGEYRAGGLEAVELRVRPEGMPTLDGLAAVFHQWTTINSAREGKFLERFAPGSFANTIEQDRHKIRALLEHGFDPYVGDKVLGPIEDIREDDTGLRVTVPLLETSYNRDLVPALEDGRIYGMSIRFRVRRGGESWKDNPKKSAHNPAGLPERTLTEVGLLEVSLTVFPAYSGTDAKIRAARTEALNRVVKAGKPMTAARRKSRLRAAGILPPEPLSASQRKAALRAMGLAPREPMTASERKKKLRRMRVGT